MQNEVWKCFVFLNLQNFPKPMPEIKLSDKIPIFNDKITTLG